LLETHQEKCLDLKKEVIFVSINAKQIIEYNESIIEDNIFFGLKNDYTETEINQYVAEAKEELRRLKKHLKDNSLVEYDNVTQMYVRK